MAAKFTASIDVSPVGTYYGQLATVLNQSLPKTIRMEAAATVRRAMQLQPVKPLGKDQLSDSARKHAVANFSNGDVEGWVTTRKRSGKVGNARLFSYNSKSSHSVPLYQIWSGTGPLPAPANHTGEGFRVRDDDWQKWKSGYVKQIRVAQQMAARRIGARGLTQKSWYQLLLKIASGDAITGVSEGVKNAQPVKGNARDIAAAVGVKSPYGYTLDVVNASGIAVATDGQRKLNTAISIRRKFFLNNLEKGFYSDAKFVARNYKWATVSG